MAIKIEQIADAVGTSKFDELLLTYFDDRYFDVDFLDLGGKYAEDVCYEEVSNVDISDESVTADLSLSYTENMETGCSNVTFPTPRSCTVRFVMCRTAPYDYEIEVIDEDWRTDGEIY